MRIRLKGFATAVQFFDRIGRPVQLCLAFAAVLFLGLIDYLTGHQAFFAVFYLSPIAFVAWHVGPRWAVGFSGFSAIVWVLANTAAGQVHTESWIVVWNTLTRLAVFLIVSGLLSALRAAHDQERKLARTDHLTGAENRRNFYDLAERERLRCKRYHRPFTVIYADVDNFKAVNDTLGHSAGDALLREVVATAKRDLRRVDVVARLGGDEFAILLPETGAEPGLHVARRVRDRLEQAMGQHGWPVSFSVGVVTCIEPPSTIDELLSRVDQLMYAVKGAGKNGIRHAVLGATRAVERVCYVAVD